MNEMLQRLETVISEVLDENTQLKAALARAQRPEGLREEDVAEWLRKRGYVVIRPMEVSGND